MKSLRFLDRRVGYSLGSIGLLLGMIAPAVMPAFASADVLTARSVTLSTATHDAGSVTYDVKFTAPGAIDGTGTQGGVVIYFCDDSPLLGASCHAPGGFSATGVSVTEADYAGTPASSNGTVASAAANSLKWTAGADFTAGNTLELKLAGIHNPTAVGTFYARITTYADDTALATSTGTDATAPGTYQDDGAVALSTSATIGVNAYVLESMSFCTSKGDIGNVGNATDVSSQAAPSIDCGSHELDCVAPGVDAGCDVAPDLTIGKKIGNVVALDAGEVSTGGVYAQLSTNAANGAVVSLKSDATGCGGLYLNGDTAKCNIGPASSGITAGTAGFGLEVGTPVAAPLVDGTTRTDNGTFANNGSYNGSTFFIDYHSDNTAGITSTYGSPLIHSTGVVDNMNIPLTFGATTSNNTAAGSYGAKFNLIATATF